MTIVDVLTWMSFGILLLLIQYGIWWYLKSKGKNTIGFQLGGFGANFFLVFSFAWGYASFVEGEYQAVAMGFLFFGGVALIPAIITYRLANRSTKKTIEKGETNAI
ncbi:hypothetical protein [Dehalobacter restrictus]|uniref:Tetrachloroethene dehalogenase n=1 Tax=Dehalobacter restrictus (strain DSM 9455 / PER-K23) TaxID=871738 RepID=A0ABM5P6V4_DEHRP|nr:hypothetical protein [Dehalobacter restrictus]AHF10440.1 tetrachloroethene dehalogenase [Dehalobacter restrictus DSM 9455]